MTTQMQPALSPTLSFCVVDGRHIFLDQAADRYFCLGQKLEAAFATLIAHGMSGLDEETIGRLNDTGLIRWSGQGRPLLSSATPLPETSLLDVAVDSTTWAVVHAAYWLARSTLSLKLHGLAGALDALRRTRAVGAKSSAVARRDPLAAAHYAIAFQRTAFFQTTHDRCLVRSLALAHCYAASGLDAELVFGVRLRPFLAHCWVQREGQLANDRYDAVRHFTPILIL